MDGKIFPAPQRGAAPPEAGDGAGLDVFNTLPIFAHACRLRVGARAPAKQHVFVPKLNQWTVWHGGLWWAVV